MRSTSHRIRSTPQRRLHRIGAVFAAVLLLPATALGATLVVDDDGTYDAGTDGCDGPDATYSTINAANTAAVDFDTIFVCPGTYVETQVNVTKALTFQGSGAASTFIDGGGGTGLTSAGTLRIRTTTGDVTVDGFTIQNPSAQGASATGLRFGVSAKSTAPVTYTFTNNVIKGMNNPAWGMDYGFYTDGPGGGQETLVFQYNTITETGSNPMLIERHPGPTDVSYNVIDRGVYSGGLSAYFNFSHSGTVITSLQRVSNNVINMAADGGPYTSSNGGGAISFVGAFTGGSAGSFSNVEITDNEIVGVEAYRRGISLFNNAPAPGTIGDISNAVIRCNTISGPGTPQAGSYGIRFNGLITDPDIRNNAIDSVDTAFAGLIRNTHVATGITLNENSFTSIGTYAIDWQSDVSFDAEANWYDDPSGPTATGNPGGTGAAIGASGGPPGSPVVDYDPWLESGSDADPGPCFVPDAGPCTIVDPGQIFATKPKSRVVLKKINTDTTPDNDGLVATGFFTLPPGLSFADFTPVTDGARVVLTRQDDGTVFDATLPGGAYNPATRVGWRLSGNGKTWKFIDRSDTPVDGIRDIRVADKENSKFPRRVKVKVKGKKANYPVVNGDEPVQIVVTLGGETAAAQGLCGTSDYQSGDCVWNGKQNKLSCRR